MSDTNLLNEDDVLAGILATPSEMQPLGNDAKSRRKSVEKPE
jgi:hypothetical protein